MAAFKIACVSELKHVVALTKPLCYRWQKAALKIVMASSQSARGEGGGGGGGAEGVREGDVGGGVAVGGERDREGRGGSLWNSVMPFLKLHRAFWRQKQLSRYFNIFFC